MHYYPIIRQSFTAGFGFAMGSTYIPRFHSWTHPAHLFIPSPELCTNLCECHLCPLTDSNPPPVLPPTSIQLPHLWKLGLDISKEFLYADFLWPLVFPKLKEFTFILPDWADLEDYLKEFRETIACLSILDLHLEVHYHGYGGDDILELAHSLPPLTSIKAYRKGLPASMVVLILALILTQKTCFQTITSLEIATGPLNTKDLVEMFKTHWMYAQQSNNNLFFFFFVLCLLSTEAL